MEVVILSRPQMVGTREIKPGQQYICAGNIFKNGITLGTLYDCLESDSHGVTLLDLSSKEPETVVVEHEEVWRCGFNPVEIVNWSLDKIEVRYTNG